MKKELDLVEIRNKIDEIDSEILKLLEERILIVNEVVEYKMLNNMKVLDKEREKKILEKLNSKIENKDLKEHINNIFVCIMDESKKYQEKKIGDKNEIR